MRRSTLQRVIRAHESLLTAGVTAIAAIAGSIAMAQTKIVFDRVGALPADWRIGITGKGVARWDVVADGSAPSARAVLRQSGEATFCWAVRQNDRFRDGFVEVKLKPVAGREDQAGGIVWRFQDENNYYIDESPRLYFMHFWAVDDAVRLAGTLHAALAKMKVRAAGT